MQQGATESAATNGGSGGRSKHWHDGCTRVLLPIRASRIVCRSLWARRGGRAGPQHARNGYRPRAAVQPPRIIYSLPTHPEQKTLPKIGCPMDKGSLSEV